MTNLTPAQLEQFEHTFRYFAKDESNALNLAEMIAALASLGIVYSEDDMNYIYDELVRDYGAVTFEAFINLLVCHPSCDLLASQYVVKVDIMEDQTSREQLLEAFRGIASDKVCHTNMPLIRAYLTGLTIARRDGA
jgi:Ca2+-binding EF-hand superfamily protein